jgi:DNA-binding PadR family transcriptional regulator
VYPTLQLLEDQGYVTSNQAEGKRVYTITDEGRTFLEERSDTVDDVHARMHAGWEAYAHSEIRDVVQEVRGLAQFLMGQVAHGALKDPETRRRLKEAVAQARAQIEAIFREDGPPPTVL